MLNSVNLKRGELVRDVMCTFFLFNNIRSKIPLTFLSHEFPLVFKYLFKFFDKFGAMAYRRKQGISRSSTFQEESIFRSPAEPKHGISRSSTFHHDSATFRSPGDPFISSSSSSSSSLSLAAQAIRASAVHRDRSSQVCIYYLFSRLPNKNKSIKMKILCIVHN